MVEFANREITTLKGIMHASTPSHKAPSARELAAKLTEGVSVIVA